MQLLVNSLVFLGVFSGDDGLHFTELVTHALSTVLSGDEGDDGRCQTRYWGAGISQDCVVRLVKHPGGPKRSVSTSHVQSLDDSLHWGQEQFVQTDCGSGNL